MALGRILVAILDWGLGHASRTIPIIRALQAKNQEVIIASAGSALQMLQVEFPELECIELPAYRPVYPTHRNMAYSMALQTPRFLKVIYKEHQMLKKIVEKYAIKGIIADNRYGMYHDQIPCVFITHQVFIQTPALLNILKPALRFINQKFIDRFTYCWIPDVPGKDNLSGVLSREGKLPNHVRFIGLLSRFEKKQEPLQYDLLIVLSGPEPQRTILEHIFYKQLRKIPMRVLLVRGVFEKDAPAKTLPIEIKNFLVGNEMTRVFCSSRLIVSRSGYSTAMDVICTEKKAVFVPTPGQTEQEYLAAYWKSKQWFYAEEQEAFDLKRSLDRAAVFSPPYSMRALSDRMLEKALSEFIKAM